MPSRRYALVAAAALAALVLPASAGAQTPPPWLKLQDGVTQPQFALADAIEQTVYVETPLDTDRDGRRDRVRIRVSRPGQTESQGIDVPVVLEHSPYRGDLGNALNHPVDVDDLPQSGAHKRASTALARPVSVARAKADLPGTTLDDYYVPRGYAVVLGESIGTFGSDGCPDVGGPAETLGTKAVIDWLNGRARGFDEAGQPVRADWTTGDVGMTGTSYNGTLPNQVATTGVEGLKTIIPVSAISSWYDYYRANGLVVAPHSEPRGVGENAYLGEDTDVLGDFIGGPRMNDRCLDARQFLLDHQDRVTGDWNDFWQARDYLHRVDRIRASVFVVHGLNDFNVRTKAFAEWWYRLSARHIPRKLWLHNGGHGGPAAPDRPAYKLAENRWFDRWLFGVQNGITSEPRVHIQREDGTYRDEADWPAPGTRTAQLALHGREQSFIDRGRELDTDDVLIQNPDTANPNRLAFTTAPLSRDVRLSGTPWVDLRMSIDNRDDANLTAVLVDSGPGAPEMVTRGWLDPQNRDRLDRSRPIRQGKEYGFSWDLQPDDHVFAAGHRIGLVVVSTDHDYTIRPRPGTQLTLDPGHSRIRLPIVGGARGLGLYDHRAPGG
jgi:X-Pro dipeptidyl-peptidase